MVKNGPRNWLFNFLVSGLILHISICIVCAEVATDGTLGPQKTLNGPIFAISDNLGQTVGPNLFHSFAAFNIASDEAAVFTGPAQISNIIGRVTGGNLSSIDGLLKSEIAGADVYLINPAGVVFGPNASLNVGGSLHVSTADFLRLGDDGIFYAEISEDSVLTVDSPSAFGFLSESPAGISV